MEVSRQQLENLHTHMNDLLESVHSQEDRTKKNIRRTNTVIVFFTLLGATLAIVIFSLFISLTQAITHSISSMEKIQHQVADVRETMESISTSVASMGEDVETLYYMSDSVGRMAMKTGVINSYIAKLHDQTGQMSVDASRVRYHTGIVNQRFGSINHAIGDVSRSLYETARPVRQFMPLP